MLLRELPNAIGKWKGSSEAILTIGISRALILVGVLLKSTKEYQQHLFSEVRTEDELVILARGLGLLRLVINLLHSYDAAGNNLIVVVGADERENGWIGEGIRCQTLEAL